MCLRELAMLLCGVVCITAAASAADSPNLGRDIKPAELAAWDISAGPDGKGLPGGQGTPKQGALVFAEKCAACHGGKGEGGPNDALVGGIGTLTTATPVATVGSYWPYATTLFDYIRRAMPLYQPQSLSSDETYALAAYVLNLNGIVGDTAVMNATTLPKVRMPNRDQFFIVYPGRLQ